MKLTKYVLKKIKQIVWSLIIAFMDGIHNFYHNDYQSPESITSTIEIPAWKDITGLD